MLTDDSRFGLIGSEAIMGLAAGFGELASAINDSAREFLHKTGALMAIVPDEGRQGRVAVDEGCRRGALAGYSSDALPKPPGRPA